MKSTTLAIILLLQLHLEVATKDGFCSADTKSDCGSEKGAYSQFSNEILAKIAAAEAGHEECTEGGCKCYEAVIDSDLAKFPTVTREMLTEIRDKIFLPGALSSLGHLRRIRCTGQIRNMNDTNLPFPKRYLLTNP